MNQISELKILSDKLLLENIYELKVTENKAIADLVLYLSEIDSRKLYREIGFSSMFSYCTASIADGGLG